MRRFMYRFLFLQTIESESAEIAGPAIRSIFRMTENVALQSQKPSGADRSADQKF